MASGNGVRPSLYDTATAYGTSERMMNSYRHFEDMFRMKTAVRKTVSLPANLARDVEEVAGIEGKTSSAVVEDALRQARSARLREELGVLQGHWSRRAQERGIVSEEDLDRYLQA